MESADASLSFAGSGGDNGIQYDAAIEDAGRARDGQILTLAAATDAQSTRAVITQGGGRILLESSSTTPLINHIGTLNLLHDMPTQEGAASNCHRGLNHTSYRKRKRGGKSGPAHRIAPGEPSAITRAIQIAPSRPNQAVFFPSLGTTFNSCEEEKEFYNIYSWEVGFGIRTGKSKFNTNGYQAWQDYVCTCEGFAPNPNAASCRTSCDARIRLHRSEDDGWFISVLVVEHNHPLSESYHEKKQWRSHGDIDPTTKNFIRNLRDNNINLGKYAAF